MLKNDFKPALAPVHAAAAPQVHEYGGGEHLVTPDKVYFSNFA
jgi:hypothetical protein